QGGRAGPAPSAAAGDQRRRDRSFPEHLPVGPEGEWSVSAEMKPAAPATVPDTELLLRTPRLPLGFQVAGVACGLKKRDRAGKAPLDVAVLLSRQRAATAGVFTPNRFAAAPIAVCRDHLRRSLAMTRGVVVNSGGANAATGRDGERRARAVATGAARLLDCRVEEILVASTGVIGRPLRHDRILRVLPGAVRGAARPLSPSDAGGLYDAARAIMTTDTRP